MSMKYSNPARRLHTILSAGREIDRAAGCRNAWGALLEVEPNSPELLRKLAKVMMLPEQVMDIVGREFPARAGIQRHWDFPVRKAFESQNLSSTWSTFIDSVNEPVVDFLAMTSDLIEEKTNNDDIAEDELISVRDGFISLSDEIANSDLSPRIKVMIVRMISRIISALNDYKVSGSADILSAIDMALGKAVYDIEYREVLSETKEGVKFRDAMAAAADMTTVSSGLSQITSEILKMLGGS